MALQCLKYRSFASRPRIGHDPPPATAVFYVAILNFYQVASDMMQNTGDMISSDLAGLYMAIPNFVDPRVPRG